MAADERWYFTREQLANTPSRRAGVDADKELSYRQQAANFIQDMGQRLVVSQLCINTAIVYMHRFYVFHSLTHFPRNAIAVAALFLAAKVEEQPRKLEHVIKMAYMCLHRDQPPPESRSELFLEQAQDLVFNENVLLQTLGFDVAIDHPHTHVVRCCQLVKGTASKDLAQTSYFMASNSLHLTTMCLQYKPTVVACFCIHLACKWSNWEIPQSTEGKEWFWYVDRTVTAELLQELTNEFLHIFDKCPSRLKRKIMSISANQSPNIHPPSLPNSPFDTEPRRIQSPAMLDGATAAVVAHFNRDYRAHHAVEGASAAHSSRSHHVVDGAAPTHSSRSHHAAEGTAGAPAAAAAHSSRSHHAADGTSSTSTTAVTVHSSRSHHTTDGAVAHSSRSHYTMDSAATATAVTAHSSRSHHGQQEKQDEKKTGSIAGLSTSRATAIDYREYREKKERERLEREKAVAAIGCHVTDPNKPHHSHHHKQVSNASMPSKHQIPSVQKGTGLHHNHHHRPDMKVGQPVPQRHSTCSQPNRDPSRRLPREHSAGMADISAGIAHSSHHANLDSSSSESIAHRSDSGAVQDAASSAHGSLQEKISNNHTGHRLNALDSKHQAHDKRLYRGEDPRLKSAKYADFNRMDAQLRRKAEQRCEEVRKLIEKPLPPPKQADIPYLMNAQQKQQAHHAKYNQQQQDKASSFTGDMKHAASVNQNALPQGTSPSASSSQKSAPVKTQMYSQHTAQGVSQILKDIAIKNGNSQSCLSTLNNVDDTKSDKRSRSTAHEEFAERNSVDVQQGNLHTPPGKHRSLFSPETPIVPRESHAQGARPKSKQKTPPSAATKMKERVSPFTNSPTLQDSLTMKRPSNDGVGAAHKKMRAASSIGESEQSLKSKTEIKTEDTTSLEAMKMLGRVPDLIQPIRDNTSSNNRNSSTSSVINDLKPPELIKPFESDQFRFNAMSQHKASSMNMNALTNGMDLNVVKQDLPEHRVKRESLEHYIKKEPSVHRALEPTNSQSQTKLEYTSPMKSAQSISALLQETLPPMPSLLQGLQQSSQLPPQQVHQELQHQQQQHQLQSIQHSLLDHQLPVTTQCLSIVSDNFTPIASTVDISVLSDNVSMTLPSNSNIIELTAPAASTVTAVPPAEGKRSEHHKSEKKKKKEKHKHKDKEKSKEKHKHKHKDKDKEKHREKKDKGKSDDTPTAAPIKITIPKDKLNLSTEASSTMVGGGPGSLDKNISPGLKIKIPKERLKGTDSVPSSSPAQPPMVQGPLKIKIRTDLGISRSSGAAMLPPSTSSSSNGSSGSLHMQILSSESSANETTSRKRERAELIGDNSGSSGVPLTKKQALMLPTTGGYGQGHRPGERQNGRHYNTGSNNKVRGRGVRQHHGGRGPPPHHAVAGQRGNAGGHYQREIYGNTRGSRGHQQYHSHQSHHPPTVRGHGDVGGYARGTGHPEQGTDSYFYANYPASVFSTPAGYVYDPAAYQHYYQQFQQSQYPMYPAGGNLIMTPDGTINTSVPPPSLLSNQLYQNQNIIHSQSVASTRQEDTQLLPKPPLQPPPSPPPLPSGPPPPPPPPPPPSMSE